MGQLVISISMGLVLIGIIFYFTYGRLSNNSEYALMNILNRITNKDIGSVNLNRELKDILSERDEIVFDRFDKLVDTAIFWDISGVIELDSFFQKSALKLADKIDGDQEMFYKLLKEREEDTSTAITPNVAIPHIILPGEGAFELLVVRSTEGISFSEESPSIKTIFILAGTLDERNFHLQALSAIAQIVLDPKFNQEWSEASNISELKDIIHLSERKRFLL